MVVCAYINPALVGLIMGITEEKKSRKYNLISAIIDFGQICLLLFLMLVILGSFGNRISFIKKQGIGFYSVVSGSMEPTIPVGSIVYAKKIDQTDLKVDNIVTYWSVNPETKDKSIVTHRITKIIDEEDSIKGQIHELVTKGDANNAEDPYTTPVGNVIGLYQFHIPLIGFVTNFSQSKNGFFITVVGPASLLIIWEIIELFFHLKNLKIKPVEQRIKNE